MVEAQGWPAVAFPAGLNFNLCRQGTISPGKCDPGLRQHCFALFIDSMSEKCCCFPQRINVSECRSPGAAKTEADYSCREMFKCLARGRQSIKSIVCCFVIVVFACLFLLRTFLKKALVRDCASQPVLPLTEEFRPHQSSVSQQGCSGSLPELISSIDIWSDYCILQWLLLAK